VFECRCGDNKADHGRNRKITSSVPLSPPCLPLLGNIRYAAAAKMYQRFVKDLAENDQLRREAEGLGKQLSYVEG